MSIKIVNWKLAILAFFVFCLFTSLGIWQLIRAQQKQVLVKSFNERTLHAPFSAHDLTHPNDWRFYQVQLTGVFDETHSFLLDNKTFHRQIGYEVYTPFKADGLGTYILVDRGFIPLGEDRDILPSIPTPGKKVTIAGMLNQPPSYVSLGEIKESEKTTWPLRVQYIEMNKLAGLSDMAFFPYILTLTPNDPAAFPIEWKPVISGPERNKGYAVQWFALALTLLILFVALNRRANRS